MSEITDHCDKLMNLAVDSLKMAFANCMLHVTADLNVPQEHASVGVVKAELKSRLAQAVDGL